MLPKDTTPSAGPRLLWIEDDLRYVSLLKPELSHRFDFQVYPCINGEAEERIREWKSQSIDGVVLDMHLAEGKKAPAEFTRLRELGYDGPIFVLSNDETVMSKLEMLSLGVDDYLWKVMPTQEIELRLNNVIQKYRTKFNTGAVASVAPVPSPGVLSLDGLEIYLDRMNASLHGAPLDLSKIEFRIVLTLFRNHPQPTAIAELKREVWGQTQVESGTISTFLWKLNKKTGGWKHRVVRAGEETFLREVPS